LVSTIPLPFFRCRFAVPVSRCRFRTPLPLPLPLRLSAVYGCNGTEFSYVIFTEQQNFTTAEWRNGNGKNDNGMVETRLKMADDDHMTVFITHLFWSRVKPS